MELTYKKETIIKKEVAVPSFWKTEFGYYRIYEVDEDTRCDAVHLYPPINKYDFQINCGYFFNPEEAIEITEREYHKGLNYIKEYINQITPLPDDK